MNERSKAASGPKGRALYARGGELRQFGSRVLTGLSRGGFSRFYCEPGGAAATSAPDAAASACVENREPLSDDFPRFFHRLGKIL